MFPSLKRDRQSTLRHVKDYRPQTEGQQLRILLLGPVGAGKSSFINSVQSVLYGRMYTQALVDNISSASFTKKVWRTFDKENIPHWQTEGKKTWVRYCKTSTEQSTDSTIIKESKFLKVYSSDVTAANKLFQTTSRQEAMQLHWLLVSFGCC